MRPPPVVRAAIGAAVTAVLVVAVQLALPPVDSRADDAAPTWAQVQAAEGDAAAARQALSAIQSAVVRLTAEEDAAGRAELTAAYAATVAQNALTSAEARVSAITAQLDAARTSAATARVRFAATAVQIQRAGGSDLALRLLDDHGGSGDLLDELGALDQLARSSADLEAAARERQHEVDALRDAAAAAEKVRAADQADASRTLAAATSARQRAEVELADGQQQQADLAQKAQALGGQAQSLQTAYTAAQQALRARGGSVTTIDTSGVVVDPAGARAYARSALAGHGWGDDQFGCLVRLWTMESGWRADAYNTSSGAYGIPQALPADKMQTAGPDWMTNGDTQIDWGLAYIARAYGSPCGAWSFEMSHTPHWY